MGCWNETCMLTNMPILYHEKAAAVFVAVREKRYDTCYSDGVAAPIAPPFFGAYDDYGGLDDITCTSETVHILRESKFYLKEDGATKPVTINEADDAAFLQALTRYAMHDDLYVEYDDPMKSGTVLLAVYISFMRGDMYDFAVQESLPGINDEDFTENITFRTRLLGNLRTAVREKQVSDEELRKLVALYAFMECHRITWHPTTGSGSQTGIDEEHLAFYKFIYDTAAKIYDGEYEW